jgi:hypothetical protein
MGKKVNLERRNILPFESRAKIVNLNTEIVC